VHVYFCFIFASCLLHRVNGLLLPVFNFYAMLPCMCWLPRDRNQLTAPAPTSTNIKVTLNAVENYKPRSATAEVISLQKFQKFRSMRKSICRRIRTVTCWLYRCPFGSSRCDRSRDISPWSPTFERSSANPGHGGK